MAQRLRLPIEATKSAHVPPSLGEDVIIAGDLVLDEVVSASTLALELREQQRAELRTKHPEEVNQVLLESLPSTSASAKPTPIPPTLP